MLETGGLEKFIILGHGEECPGGSASMRKGVRADKIARLNYMLPMRSTLRIMKTQINCKENSKKIYQVCTIRKLLGWLY